MNMEVLIGKTPVGYKISDDKERLEMSFSDGSQASWYHEQDCCESVEIEDICGDFLDLLGHPLLVAEERSSDNHETGDGTAPVGLTSHGESDTWTFYTFRSVGGSVDVRWHGSSNGYYSEYVSFTYTPPEQGEN